MTILIVLFSIFCLVGIIYFSGSFHMKKLTREEFLAELAKTVGGQCVPLEDFANAYQIRFIFNGQEFVYEDRETRGFKDAAYKGYLKAKSGVPFTLYFTEKENVKSMRTNIQIASNIKDPSAQGHVIILPKGLNIFDFYTNNRPMASILFEDKKIVQIFLEFKNQDSRGSVSEALKIIEGELILEFHELGFFKPSRPNLLHEFSLLEDYAAKIITVIQGLKAGQKQLE